MTDAGDVRQSSLPSPALSSAGPFKTPMGKEGVN